MRDEMRASCTVRCDNVDDARRNACFKRSLGDDPEFCKEVMDMFTRYLRSQHDSDNPEWLPWINKIPLGATRYRSGVTPRVVVTSKRIGAAVTT